MSPTSNPPSEESPQDHEASSKASNRKVAGASTLMMLAVLLSRVLGLIRDRVIAAKFGQGFETDAYNAAFTVPDLISYVIAGGAISSAVIPVFTEYVKSNKTREAWRIFSVVAIVVTWVVSALVVLGELFAYPLVAKLNPGPVFAPHIAQSVVLTRILLPAQLFFFLGGLMMGIMQTKGEFFGQMIGPIVYNLGIIFGGTVLIHFAPANNRIVVLCWGALIGAFIGNIIIQWALIRKIGGYFVLRPLKQLLSNADVKAGALQVWKMMLPILVGVALPQIAAITNKLFASYLTAGAQSALMNANRMMQVPLGVFGQATAIAIFPTMAQHFADRNIKALRSTTNYGLRFIFFLTVPASALMIALALPIVQLLLQSGKYSAADAFRASEALKYYAIGIFAWSGQSILSRAFYSLKNTIAPTVVGTIATLVFLPMNKPLMHLMGYRGLALATTIASILNMLALLWLVRRRLKGIEGGRLLKSVVKILISSVVASLTAHKVYMMMWSRMNHNTSVLLHSAEILLVCFSIGVSIYLGVGLMLRMEELNVISDLRNKLRARRTRAHR
jgi:putative peptidoglycan lipid II flippase